MRFKKLVLFIISLFCILPAMAQRDNLNMVDHDDKLYYFGITFGLNFSEYRVHYTSAFVHTDTFKTIQPRWSPGFNLGLMANLRLNKFIDLRFVPSLSFAEKRLVFDMTYPTDSTSDRTIEAILMHLPLQLKFKSDRIRNFR